MPLRICTDRLLARCFRDPAKTNYGTVLSELSQSFRYDSVGHKVGDSVPKREFLVFELGGDFELASRTWTHC